MDINEVKNQDLDTRIRYYLSYVASNRDNCDYDNIMHILNITDEDIQALQARCHSLISMKPAKKRDAIIRNTVKPLLKDAGFKFKKNSWWKNLTDGCLIIHLKNSQFNSIVSGASFSFEIFTVPTDNLTDDITSLWIYHQSDSLNQFDFYPLLGKLNPFYGGGWYKIDGYKNYLPSDVPIEQIEEQISNDFKMYLLPNLLKINSINEWNDIVNEKRNLAGSKDSLILNCFMLMVLAQSLDLSAFQQSIPDDINISPNDLVEKIEWLRIIEQHSTWPLGNMASKLLSSIEAETVILH